MALPTFPISVPGGLQRLFNWNENVTVYDSGAQQGDTPFQRPLYQWTVPIQNMNELKQSSVWNFVMDRQGRTKSFLMRDPYDYRVNSVLAVRSGITNAATLYFYDVTSFMVRPDSTTVGSLFSSLSGFVKLGTQYSLDQDTGIVTINTKAANDVWGVRSMTYFKKARFGSQYNETATIWNVFQAQLLITELP